MVSKLFHRHLPDDSLSLFFQQAKHSLSEQLRFHQLRILTTGLFVEESALNEVFEGYKQWYSSYTSEHPERTLPTEEKIKKRFFQKLGAETKYLLDGKTLLCGRELLIPTSTITTHDIPHFQGSLLDACSYIHMRDPIFEATKGVSAHIGSKGLVVEFSTRKHPITVDNAHLQQLAKILQQSRSLPKRFGKVRFAARQSVPAFAEIWKKAQVVPGQTRLFIPENAKSLKKAWYLLYGDLIFVQNETGELVRAYGLRGKNLHYFLTEELEHLRKLHKRPRFSSMTISPNGRGYGFVKLEGERYLLDPLVVRKFIERMPFSRDLSKKIPPRFTLSDAISRLVPLIESSKWMDSIHVPKSFAAEHPKGTNFRSEGAWCFALSKKKHIVALLDKHEKPFSSNRKSHHSSSGPIIGLGSIRGHYKR